MIFEYKLDLIIPYYSINKYMAENILNDLLNQSVIEEINVIFICDGCYQDYILLDQLIHDLNAEFKNIFHKHVGQAGIKNYGMYLEECSAPAIGFWDFDDGFFSKFSLERVLEKISLTNYDIWQFLCINVFEKSKTVCFFKRSFIENNGLHFPKLYKEEDTAFVALVSELSENISFNNVVIGRWNSYQDIHNPKNICSTPISNIDNQKHFLLFQYFQYFFIKNHLIKLNRDADQLALPDYQFVFSFISSELLGNIMLELQQLLEEQKIYEFLCLCDTYFDSDNVIIKNTLSCLKEEVDRYFRSSDSSQSK